MAVKLTQKEADMLIEMLKKTAEKEIAFPQERGRVEFDVFGDRREDIFVVNISRKGINADGASYQGRLRHREGILMRLDVNPTGVHRNPDEEVIRGTHLHIYTEEYGMAVAIPFDTENKDLVGLCYAFFKHFHIIEPPAVTFQLKLEGI
ncbi:MAG: hypothetical protein LBU83_04025 [Bacteroidales bacterium]|jgi:hypothetical protein|nr:hypothetical protein [Bacteroidales bacterium]